MGIYSVMSNRKGVVSYEKGTPLSMVMRKMMQSGMDIDEANVRVYRSATTYVGDLAGFKLDPDDIIEFTTEDIDVEGIIQARHVRARNGSVSAEDKEHACECHKGCACASNATPAGITVEQMPEGILIRFFK